MYIDFKFELLFLAFVIGILISLLSNIANVFIISFIIVIIYIILVFINNMNNTTTSDTTKLVNNNNVNNITNVNTVNKVTEIKENYSDGSDYKQSNGLFDGLLPKQLVKRFNYLYEITKNPYKSAKSYSKYMFDKNNETVLNSPKHIEIAERYYPQLSKDRVNMTDCMIYDSNNPASCNQGNNKWKAEHAIMSQMKVNEEQLNQIIREDFKPPNSLLESNLQMKDFMKH